MPRLPLTVVCALLAVSTARAAGDFAYFHENVLGTSMELRVRAESGGAARRAEGRALGEIDRLAGVFSGYDPSSEFSRWQRTLNRPSKVSAELFEVLKASGRWGEVSGGAFDPRVEAVSRLWSRCAREGRAPTPAETAEAKALMGPPAWRLDERAGTAERLTGCPLSLNAIAKGYIVDRACDAALGAEGVLGVMVCIGGDLRVAGDFARRVGVADPVRDSETTEPLARVELRGRALASSGGYQRGFRAGGRWYSHVIDPRSGAPAVGVLGSTVIADRAADADALATAFGVLPVGESLRLADALPGVACLLVGADGRVARSARWGQYERPGTDRASLRTAAAPGPTWGDDFEVLVRFEINRPEANAGRYRRPYVAIWVEDKDGRTVRTVLLWVSFGGPGPFQWVPDLKRWYRNDQARKTGGDKADMVTTIARATRPPGKYEAVWDGTDDHGKPLDAGTYTISIEAAREHGTYQVIRQPVTLADRPFARELKGNVEIKSASIEYRRKPAASK